MKKIIITLLILSLGMIGTAQSRVYNIRAVRYGTFNKTLNDWLWSGYDDKVTGYIEVNASIISIHDGSDISVLVDKKIDTYKDRNTTVVSWTGVDQNKKRCLLSITISPDEPFDHYAVIYTGVAVQWAAEKQ